MSDDDTFLNAISLLQQAGMQPTVLLVAGEEPKASKPVRKVIRKGHRYFHAIPEAQESAARTASVRLNAPPSEVV